MTTRRLLSTMPRVAERRVGLSATAIERPGRADARFGTLDEAQSHAVCLFLRYMAAVEDGCDGIAVRRALEQTWGRFCE